jgi:hypothetical protein
MTKKESIQLNYFSNTNIRKRSINLEWILVKDHQRELEGV